MKSHRLPSLLALILLVLCFNAWSQQNPPRPAEAKPEPAKPQGQQQQTPAAPRPAQNPFETVPTAPTQPEAPAPANPQQQQQRQPATQQPPAQRPRLEAPPTAPEPNAAKPVTNGPAAPQDIIEGIEFRGSRRIPQETLRARIVARKGDKYDEEVLQRDFMALWNAGYFDDLKLEREAGPNGGWIIRFVVTERRVVRSIKYDGAKSV